MNGEYKMDSEKDLNFIELIDALTKEKGINRDVLFDTIKHALLTAYKKKVGNDNDVDVTVDEKTGQYKVYAIKTVVENDAEELRENEIVLNDAMKYNSKAEVGGTISIDVTPKDFGRMAVLNARQVVEQKLKEAERESLYEEFAAKQDEIIIGTVQRTDVKTEIVETETGEKKKVLKNVVYVNLEKLDCVLHDKDQVKGEVYMPNMKIPVYVYKVEKTTKSPKVYVSHAHPNLVIRLMEREIPELANGTIVIKNIVREAGLRTKVAVLSRMENVDAVGTCIGPKGMRINAVIQELKNERVDIINWDSDPKKFVANALAPSKPTKIVFDVANDRIVAVVPDAQLSVAIGKAGINVRLASKLTSMRIDIKTVSQFKELEANGTEFITVEEAQARSEARKAAEEAMQQKLVLDDNIDSLFEKWDSLILESEGDENKENQERVAVDTDAE